MSLSIGLDLGTTTLAGVLYDGDRDAVVRVARRRNDGALPGAAPTRAEQDPARLLALALDILAELAAVGDSGPVSMIGVTGQMHGVVCVDGRGQAVTPLITWQDQRTAEPEPDGATAMDEIRARLAGLEWRANGCQVAHGYGAATLSWLNRHNALPPGTERACTAPDWLAAQLAGQMPATDPTLACSWGVYDLMRAGWNEEFIARLGLDAGLFPPVRPLGEPLGSIVPAVAKKVGLPAETLIVNAVGDHPASFRGSILDPAGTVQLNLGTGGQIAWWVPAFEPPDERVETHPYAGNGFLRVGASLCGGAAFAWLNRVVRAWLAEFGPAPDEEAVYARLNALARGSDTAGLHVRPTFLGVRGDPDVRSGAIDGITLDNLRLGPLARATLLGLIDELRDLYHSSAGDAVRAAHRSLAASGNGVQKNPLMPGLLAERFGLPVALPRWDEPAAVGAASG